MNDHLQAKRAGVVLERAGAWLLAFLWILPLAYALWAAIHPSAYSAHFTLNAPLTSENFVKAWNAAPFARYFLNTFMLVTMILAAQLVLCTLAAYAFARFKFYGRELAFILVLLQLMIMPDVLIVEGLNVLQPARMPKGGEAIPFVSDFFNFSIYMDADADVIEEWYVPRFMRLRQTAFRDPAAYFHRYANLSPDEARAKALEIWRTINEKNLYENILPTRQRADLILKKGASHMVEEVALRKL